MRVKTEADRFPKAWLHIIDQPQAFYGIHAEPVNVSRAYGDPLFAKLTINNLTDSDLTIGPDGVIKRGVVFTRGGSRG